MKSSIIILFLVLSINVIAQVSFEGNGETVDSLNTPNGQNYLTIDPSKKLIAFTEEKGGIPISDSPIFNEQSRPIGLNSWNVFTFQDWLGQKGMTSPIGFTSEGLYYNEVTFDKGMYYGKVKVSSDGVIRDVDIPFLKNKSPIQSGCISKDGQYMILSLEANNTRGVEDLYIVKRKSDGSWDRAKNLGFQLNTEFQEVTPFLAEDNRTLFFATNRPGGQGSFDLYYTVRQDDSWRNWSEPVNLGPQVNSVGAETSFVYQDGAEWAYYISSQDSDGYGDVMKVKFKEDIEEDTLTTIETEVIEAVTNETEDDNSIMIKVVDAKTGESLPSEMILGDQKKIGANGLFKIDTLNNKEVEFKSPGYLPKVILLDDQLLPGENEVALSSVAKGSVITLDHVLFHRGTANMIDGSEKELNLVVEVLNDNPKITILLKGHTDNTGDPIKNLQLSEARVKSVKAYIISQGISAFRVRGKGYGGNEPVASNAAEETRKLNRRVEFEVLAD